MKLVISMGNKSKKRKKERWSNRLAIIGVTAVVISLAVVVNLKSAALRTRDMEYQLKEEALIRQKAMEESRSLKLEEQRIYVDTKQYIEEVAKEKLGLVNPDEILLKPDTKK